MAMLDQVVDGYLPVLVALVGSVFFVVPVAGLVPYPFRSFQFHTSFYLPSIPRTGKTSFSIIRRPFLHLLSPPP